MEEGRACPTYLFQHSMPVISVEVYRPVTVILHHRIPDWDGGFEARLGL
jgi:hypothetical protein